MKAASIKAAFTLVELLVAMVVFSFMAYAILQMVSTMQQAYSSEQSRLGSLGEASFALDRIQLDISSLVRRSDLPMSFIKSAANDQIGFYSRVSAANGTRSVSAIVYRINNGNLERGALGTDWTNRLPYDQAAFPVLPEANFQAIAMGVFRMQTAFIRASDGKLTQIAPAFSNLSGIVIALASVDENATLKIGASQVQSAAVNLPAAGEGQNPIDVWNYTPFQSTPLLLRNIRFFQRTFFIQ